MSDSIVRNLSPEEDELEKKFVQLNLFESELVQRELELTTLQAELQAFESRYLRVVGFKIAKLDNIKAQIAEVFAKLHPDDRVAVNDATRARVQANDSAQATGTAQAKPESNDKFKPSESIKSLYRQAAKCFHPDLAKDENDLQRRTKMMSDINAAYMEGNEDRLRTILREWEDSPDNVSGGDIGARLIRTIRNIARVQRRLSDLHSEIIMLRQSDLYLLLVKIEDAEKENRNLLHEMATQLDMQIVEQQERLDKLLDIFINSQTGKQKHG